MRLEQANLPSEDYPVTALVKYYHSPRICEPNILDLGLASNLNPTPRVAMRAAPPQPHLPCQPCPHHCCSRTSFAPLKIGTRAPQRDCRFALHQRMLLNCRQFSGGVGLEPSQRDVTAIIVWEVNGLDLSPNESNVVGDAALERRALIS